ncbi:hypothetical protein G3578_10095 [Brevibacillus sp. SYP-B805]|uniref:hypothetical protein n=1 Tax=Brevibacillus sp. SYP-B805 TaxID=1578199 RepID=UPI0013EDA193|nr:hypothetical protein [Brevibacillus sp. SYP-B805]NGQ95503.1 hypothetical protein [Brevibacillus sp. SYP-B805]
MKGRLIAGLAVALPAIAAFKTAFAGLSMSIDFAKTALSAFYSSVKEAGKREMEIVTIHGLMQDQKKADKFFNFLQKRAAESIFSEQDFLSVGKSFLPVTKDLNRLEKLMALSERLAMKEPDQGMEGAGFAIRELLSGDATSLAERFNIPRKILNQIKALDFDDQLIALDKLLNKMGLTEKFLKDIDDTGFAQWTQATDKLNLAWAKMGTEALNAIKPALKEFNKFLNSPAMNKLMKIGSELLANIGKGLASLFNGLQDAIERALNDPRFDKMDIFAKIDFVFGNIMEAFEKWMNAGGRQKLQEASEWLSNKLTNLIRDMTPKITSVAFDAGKAIGEGLVSGIMEGIRLRPEDHPLTKLQDKIEAMKQMGEDPSKTPVFKGESSFSAAPEQSVWDRIVSWWYTPSHYHGLDEVPYDGYTARLHKGEMVLPRDEAEAYRNNDGSSGGISIGEIHIHAAGGDVTDPKVVDLLAKAIVRQALAHRTP